MGTRASGEAQRDAKVATAFAQRDVVRPLPAALGQDRPVLHVEDLARQPGERDRGIGRPLRAPLGAHGAIQLGDAAAWGKAASPGAVDHLEGQRGCDHSVTTQVRGGLVVVAHGVRREDHGRGWGAHVHLHERDEI